MPDHSIRHLPTCEAPDVYSRIGRYGDLIDACRTCGRFAVTGEAQPTKEAALPLLTRWVCGNHPGSPVNWRGAGCRECVEEHNQRQWAAEKARAARLAKRGDVW